MKKLTNCKACQKEIGSGVKKCPSCGTDQRNFFGKHKILTGILALALIGGIGSAMGSSDSTAPSTNGSAPAATQKVEKKDVVSKENYDKINKGMTVDEVKAILGEPNMVSENEIDGLGKTELYHYQTGFSTTGIDVYFSNGKVNMKNWIKL